MAHARDFRLPEELSERLEKLAERTGRTKTFYVVEAIQKHLHPEAPASRSTCIQKHLHPGAPASRSTCIQEHLKEIEDIYITEKY